MDANANSSEPSTDAKIVQNSGLNNINSQIISLSAAKINKGYVIHEIDEKENATVIKLQRFGLAKGSVIFVKRKVLDFIVINFLDSDYAIDSELSRRIKVIDYLLK
ncbi:MAG: ferrous iron transport protein A [Candidatus Micrarchaeota archaeon]|nr:ferrous iron transport protein A [Candidatus Micrarchaeota archaeon]